jgi:hypothetical protein
MRIYIVGDDGITLCGETPGIVRKPERGHATAELPLHFINL